LQNDLGWVMVAKDLGGNKPSKGDDEEEADEDQKDTSNEDEEEDDEALSKKKKKAKKNKKRADDFPTGKRRWFYNPESGGIETEVMGIKAEVTIFGQPKNWAEVELSPVNK